MGAIGGTSSIEIEAPIGKVYSAVADLEALPRWQPEIKVAECLERDGDGTPVLVYVEIDVKVRRFSSDLRVTRGKGRVTWEQTDGDVKSVKGGWELEDLGSERTRADYWMNVDLGRGLGLLIRGPAVSAFTGQLIKVVPQRLKRFVEDPPSG
jgi:ribosome-associated toxin RatA of RatAB toxin-antitoxin module